MKKPVWIVASLALLWVACQAETGKGSVEDRIQKLEDEIVFLKKVFKVAGVDVEKVKEQIANENKVHELPIGNSPAMGPENAKLTIVEFSDFQCPYCARAATMLKALQEKHPNDIRVVFKHFPLGFHKEAPAASAASMAAQKQGKFWEYRYALAPFFKELTEAKFLEIAAQVGLDIEKFKVDMALDAAKKDAIATDMALGSKVGVRGTPSFYINGKKIANFGPQVVEGMLKK